MTGGKKEEKKKIERVQNHIASPTGIANYLFMSAKKKKKNCRLAKKTVPYPSGHERSLKITC